MTCQMKLQSCQMERRKSRERLASTLLILDSTILQSALLLGPPVEAKKAKKVERLQILEPRTQPLKNG